MITLVNYLSIVRVELPFFRFSRIFLPPYLSPVYILMPQYILQIKLYLHYFITLLLGIPESCVAVLATDNFLFYDFYQLLQLSTILRLKNYLGIKCSTFLYCRHCRTFVSLQFWQRFTSTWPFQLGKKLPFLNAFEHMLISISVS